MIIAVIFIHGFITIRRNKNPYKLKTTTEKVEPIERGYDGSGFDQDGVSQPRVVTKRHASHSSNEQTKTKESLNTRGKIEPSFNSSANIHSENPFAAASKTSSVTDDGFDYGEDDNIRVNTVDFDTKVNGKTDHKNSQTTADISLTDSGVEHFGADNSSTSIDIGDDIADFDYGVTENPDLFANDPSLIEEVEQKPVVTQKPLYDAPVTQPKPEMKDTISARPTQPKAKKKSTISKKEAIKRNQIELNFEEPLNTDDMPSMSALEETTVAETQPKREPLEPEVLVVSVVMPEGQVISGAALLPTLLTLGLRYGDMDIFHRHQDNAGNGKVTFSLANILNPGTFDLDNLENFTTCGVTLFMTLPNAGDAFEVFEHMLGAAKQISVEFGAQLLDDKRSVMTKQTEQHYISKIREFERKNRIALSDITARH